MKVIVLLVVVAAAAYFAGTHVRRAIFKGDGSVGHALGRERKSEGAVGTRAYDNEMGYFAMYRQNIRRTGYLDVELGTAYTERWRMGGINPNSHSANKASGVYTSDGRRLLIPGDSGIVYCFDAQNGTLLWGSSIDPRNEYGIHGTPLVHRGVLYIGAYDGAMYAFRVHDGVRVWRTQIGGSIGSSPLLFEGKIFVSVETPKPSGILAVLDAETGALLHASEDIANHPHSSVAVDEELRVLAVGANDGVLYIYSVDAPYALLRTFELERIGKGAPAIKGPIMIYEHCAFFGAWNGLLHAVHVANGTLRWAQAVGDSMGGVAVDEGSGVVYQAVHGSSNSHSGVVALNATDGTIVWYASRVGRPQAPVLVTRNQVLLGTVEGGHRWGRGVGKSHSQMVALWKENGTVAWRWRPRGKVGAMTSVPSVNPHDGSIAVAWGETQFSAGCPSKCVQPGAVAVVQPLEAGAEVAAPAPQSPFERRKEGRAASKGNAYRAALERRAREIEEAKKAAGNYGEKGEAKENKKEVVEEGEKARMVENKKGAAEEKGMHRDGAQAGGGEKGDRKVPGGQRHVEEMPQATEGRRVQKDEWSSKAGEHPREKEDGEAREKTAEEVREKTRVRALEGRKRATDEEGAEGRTRVDGDDTPSYVKRMWERKRKAQRGVEEEALQGATADANADGGEVRTGGGGQRGTDEEGAEVKTGVDDDGTPWYVRRMLERKRKAEREAEEKAVEREQRREIVEGMSAEEKGRHVREVYERRVLGGDSTTPEEKAQREAKIRFNRMVYGH